MDALVHFDPGDDAFARQEFRKRLVAGDRTLPERLVEQDHSAHEFLYPLGGEEEIAVGAAVRLGALDPDRREAFFAGAARFVRRYFFLATATPGCCALALHVALPTSAPPWPRRPSPAG